MRELAFEVASVKPNTTFIQNVNVAFATSNLLAARVGYTRTVMTYTPNRLRANHRSRFFRSASEAVRC